MQRRLDNESSSATGVDSLITTKAAAEMLSVSEYWLHQQRSRGLGPRYVRLGRKVFYRPRDLEDYVNTCIVETVASREA